jgi:F-type H+-transporting ATPase subunit epsilon
MKVEILTPRKIEFQDEAEVLILPTQVGEISVLPRHAAMVSVLKAGRIKIVSKGKETVLEIEGGVLEVKEDKATILLKNFNVQ